MLAASISSLLKVLIFTGYAAGGGGAPGPKFGPAGSALYDQRSISVTPADFSGWIRSAILSLPGTRGRSRRLHVVAPSRTPESLPYATLRATLPSAIRPISRLVYITSASKNRRRYYILNFMALRFLLATMLLALFAGIAQTAPGNGCPTDVVQDASSSVPLSDVCIPEGYTDIPMDYFDDFSWRELVAMVWPASNGHRGVADTSKKVGDSGPRVFETYKSLYELFHDDGSAPTAFNQYDPAQMNVCKATQGFGDLVLGSKNGIDDIGQVGVGELIARWWLRTASTCGCKRSTIRSRTTSW